MSRNSEASSGEKLSENGTRMTQPSRRFSRSLPVLRSRILGNADDPKYRLFHRLEFLFPLNCFLSSMHLNLRPPISVRVHVTSKHVYHDSRFFFQPSQSDIIPEHKSTILKITQSFSSLVYKDVTLNVVSSNLIYLSRLLSLCMAVAIQSYKGRGLTQLSKF